MKTVVCLSMLFCIGVLNRCNAQDLDAKLKPAQKKEIVAKVVSLLKDNYVFVEKADVMGKELQKKLETNQYDSFETLDSFGDQLNRDLLSLSNDRHLQINFSPKIVRQLRKDAAGEKQAPDEGFIELLKSENFRMRKVEILHGNIGYFKLDNFVELKYCKETLTGAMNFISNSSAIILDLSECGGGPSETMDFILSYFLPEATKIGELRFRKNNELKESYTIKDPAIKKLTEVPLFILVSNNTASAAEGLAACLKEYKRAVLVGGQTKGLGNPGELFVINDVLYMFITTAVSGTAKSGANFDGKGITPDVVVPSSHASFNFNKAMSEVCRLLKETAKDKKLKHAGQWLGFEYETYLNPEMADEQYLRSIVGIYDGNRKIILENKQLYFDNGSLKRKLTYMGQGVFSAEGRKDYRFYFPTDGKKIDAMKVLWFDDTDDSFKRMNE
ncbi:S41 family peptidase [bacterium]|nr:S41 family peptidase [bacterium]